MKILKRVLLVLLAILLVAQIPFIYRRYQTGKLAEKIAELDAQRTTHEHPKYKEYKGVVHAHTSLGGHSTGSFDELIAAANANDLDFVLMTEHYSETFDTAALTLNGVFGKTLFIGGNEIDTSDGDRFLLIPGGGETARARMSGTTMFLEKAKEEQKIALITYPERFKSWDSAFDGIEIFSLHTSAKQMNWLTAVGDLIWSYPSYPELTLAKSFQRPDVNLAKFDEIASQRALSLFSGTDAHSNIGFHIFGDDAGNKLINIKLDPYATTFGVVRLHVLLFKGQAFNEENLLRAVLFGQAFVAFDSIGDGSGFMFEATENNNGLQGMGGSVAARPGLGLRATAPQNARFVIFKDGAKFFEASGTKEISADGSEPGLYRVEVYRDDLGPPFEKIPWIISNPIYVRDPAFFTGTGQ